jgi:c-di-GMP-binding flagellar brake protein YcgR
MSTARLKSGNRLDISTQRRTPIIWSDAYSSKIDDITDDETIIIQTPIHKGNIVRLPVNSNCTVRVKTNDGFMQYDAKIIEHLREGNFNFTVIRLNTRGEKTSQRDFFRYNCAIDTDFYILNEDGEPEGESIKGMIRDVGGGGMRLMSKTRVPVNSIIRLTLLLERSELMIFGQVILYDRNPNALFPFQYRIRFTAMSSAEQDKLIKFIHQEQRKNIQRV